MKQIPFDIYFYNFEDPKVLHAMTDGTQKGLNLWKKTYGFDHAYWLPGQGPYLNSEKAYEHCLEAEYGKYGSFAIDCKKNKGLFKCCLYRSVVFTVAIVT